MGQDAGRFTWYELMTTDPTSALAFYADLVGWTSEAFGPPGSGYTMVVGSQGPLGGVMALPESAAAMGAPPHWLGSVIVKDADDTVAKVRKLGGAVHVEPHDMPTVGRHTTSRRPVRFVGASSSQATTRRASRSIERSSAGRSSTSTTWVTWART